MTGQDAVLAHDGHNVGGDADGAQVQQRNQLRELYTVVLRKGLHEFEAHSTAAQVLVGIGVILAFGIQDGHRRRQHLVGHVMVTDDEVYSALTCIGYLLHSLDAAVEHNHQSHARLSGIIHTLARHSVTLLISVGDVIVDIGIILLQESIHQCNGCASVHIVVSIHQDALLTAKSSIEPGHCLVHILEQERVKQFGELRAKEGTGFLCSGDTTFEQESAKHRADTQRLG